MGYCRVGQIQKSVYAIATPVKWLIRCNWFVLSCMKRAFDGLYCLDCDYIFAANFAFSFLIFFQFLSTKNLHHYDEPELTVHFTHRQNVWAICCLIANFLKTFVKTISFYLENFLWCGILKLEALLQCIPPPRHTSYQCHHLTNQYKWMSVNHFPYLSIVTNMENNPLYPQNDLDRPKISSLVHWHVANLPWKFYTNPFGSFCTKLLTDRQTTTKT